MLIDFKAIRQFLEDACGHYENSAPTVSEYLDGLYQRIDSDPKNVSLFELFKVSALLENGGWEHPSYAANRIYKIMSEVGLSTIGHAGF